MSALAECAAPTLEEEVLGLWSEGFDTACIAEVLSIEAEAADAPIIPESTVARIVAAETDRRHAARQREAARS